MSYRLGVDLGTTYTAAAVCRDNRAEVLPLGDHSPQIASIVYLREDDGTFLVGEPALRRGTTEPARMAREFKRRLGDQTALMLGGTPVSAEALTARLLREAVDIATERHGERAAQLVVTHPANWGPYRLELLRHAVQLADVGAAETISEPAAAAVHFASTERVEVGDTVAVYDLGGGTFDAAIMQKTESGFTLRGAPEGIEHLGGLEFDQAVLGHVLRSVGDQIADLDQDDPATITGLARLRRECTDAKEALSTDSETVIPVVLPGLQTTVRLTRAEFEDMVRPLVLDTVACLRRAMVSAKVAADDLAFVVLVGGSARVPLVAEILGNDLGRPVAVSPQPKHCVALGAAQFGAVEVPRDITSLANDAMGVGGATAVEPSAAAVAERDRADSPRAAAGQPGPVTAREPVPAVPGGTVVRAPTPPKQASVTGEAGPGEAGPGDNSGRLLAMIVAVLACLAILAFVVPVLGGNDTPAHVTTELRSADLSSDPNTRVRVDLDTGLQIVNPTGPVRAHLDLTLLGFPVASDEADLAPDGSGFVLADLDLRSSRWWIAGPVRAHLVLEGGSGATDLEREFVLVPDRHWYNTVAGGAIVVSVMFVLAYVESILRPVRRRGRARVADLLGMIVLGCLTGAAVISASWSVTKNLLSPLEFGAILLLGGALGALTTRVVEAKARTKRSRSARQVS